MSFKFEKVEELHRMSGEKAIDFSHAIFGPTSKLGLKYFSGKDSISTKHLELLSEHFGVPMSYFFDDSVVTHVTNIDTVVKENKVGVGKININSDADHLEEEVKRLQAELAKKEEAIKWMQEQMSAMTEALRSLSQLKASAQ